MTTPQPQPQNQQVEYNGTIHQFPPDASQEEIAAALQSQDVQPPQKSLMGHVGDWAKQQWNDFQNEGVGGSDRNLPLKDQIMQGMSVNAPYPKSLIQSAESSVPGGAAEAAVKELPTVAKTGRLFEQVEQAGKAAGQRVNPDQALMDLSQRASELSNTGHELPKVLRDFAKRMSPSRANPGPVQPLTFQEARDFFSKATNLSAQEKMNLGGKMPAVLKQFTNALDGKIRAAADAMGQGETYAKAMKDYPLAQKVQAFKEGIPGALAKGAKYGLGAAGAGTAAKIGYDTIKGMLP